jgi:hypothetical protein
LINLVAFSIHYAYFLLNIFKGHQIPINPSVDEHLFPVVTLHSHAPSIEANFGDDKDIPFEYDIKKCPGMGLE